MNQDKCKPKKCRQECKKSCPVVRMGAFELISLAVSLKISRSIMLSSSVVSDLQAVCVLR